MIGFAQSGTICWSCRNAVPGGQRGCSWSERLTPVPGWRAIRSGNNEFDTWCVLDCPEYVPDQSEKKGGEPVPENPPEQIGGGTDGADQSRIDPPQWDGKIYFEDEADRIGIEWSRWFGG